MIFNTKNDKKLQERQLINVHTSNIYVFEEEQNGETNEKYLKFPQRLYLDYRLKEGQSGYIGEEYRPPYTKSFAKSPDILAIVCSSSRLDQSTYLAYLIDAKRQVSEEHDISHLIEQWADGMKHLNTITQYAIQEDSLTILAVATDNFDTSRMDIVIERKEKELNNFQQIDSDVVSKNISYVKMGTITLKEKKILRMMKEFRMKKITLNEKTYEFDVFITEFNQENNENAYTLILKLE